MQPPLSSTVLRNRGPLDFSVRVFLSPPCNEDSMIFSSNSSRVPSYPASLTCDAILKFGQHLDFFSISVQKRYRAVIIVDSKRRAIDTIDCNELAISWSRFKGVYLLGSSYFLPSPSLCLRPQVPASKTTARYASIEPEPTTQTYLPR